MSYIEQNLSKDETIVLMVEKSKIPLFWSWVWGILGFWLLLIPTVKAIKATIAFNTTELAVTNKKVVEKYGWLNTLCDEMQLSSIENIVVVQSMGGKMFHYGNIHIQGTNRNHIDFFAVKNPDAVKRSINDLR